MKCLWSTTLISSWNEWTKATWSNVLNYETMCNENKQIVEWEPLQYMSIYKKCIKHASNIIDCTYTFMD